jgi:hypothetical protein
MQTCYKFLINRKLRQLGEQLKRYAVPVLVVIVDDVFAIAVVLKKKTKGMCAQ